MNVVHAAAMASSDWSSLAPDILHQVITLLSNEEVVSTSVLPEERCLCSLQVVCRHWRNRARKLQEQAVTICKYPSIPQLELDFTPAGQSVGHLPLTQGKDLQLGMLLHRFDQLQSLQVHFKALTADSIASLQYPPSLCQLDIMVDSLQSEADKKAVESVFLLTKLHKLRLDVGPHKGADLAAYAWTKLSQLQSLTFGSCYRATPEQYSFISNLTTLQTLHLIYNCASADTLSCLTRLTGLNIHLREQHKASILIGLQALTGLRSLKIDGQPCANSVKHLAALSNLQLTSLGFWPDPYRFGCLSKCPLHHASCLCQLEQLQQLRCAFADGKRFVSAQLTHKSTYRKPVRIPSSPVIICFNLWKSS